MGCAHWLPSALLLLLLLLLCRGEASASPRGELCQGWAPAAFRCPRVRNGADAAFCCGTCGAPHCCAAGEARLDPRRCARAALRGTTPLGEPRAPQPPTRDPRWKDRPGFVVFIVVAVGTALWFFAYYCKERYCHWSYGNVLRPDENSELVRLRTLRRSRTRAAPQYGAVEAEDQGERPPLLPAALAQAAASGALEKEHVARPLAHGKIPGHAVQPTLDMGSSADQGSLEKEGAASGTNYSPRV